MRKNIFYRIHCWEQDLHDKYKNLPDTAEGARKAAFYMRWLDHEILRVLWTNFYQVAPGVWRGNHPTQKRWNRLKKIGIHNILNLRKADKKPPYLGEVRLCEELGVNLITVLMNARAAPKKERILDLIETFKTVERPFFMHCKSGVDRTGLAAAIYLLVIEGASLETARKMLSPKYLHLKQTQTGVLDAVLDEYGKTGGDFEAWVRNEYDHKAI